MAFAFLSSQPKTSKILLFAFLGGGLLFGAIGGGVAIHTGHFLSNAAEAQGMVASLERHTDSDGDWTYSPVVDFSVDNRPYTVTGSTSSNPPAFAVGEYVTVYYDPTNPMDAKVGGFVSLWLLPVIFSAFGILFAGIPIIIMVVMARNHAKRERVRQNGRRIEAKVTGIGYNTSIEINGKCPWCINAQWLNPVNNTIYTFQSEDLWFDPTEYMRESVWVFIDQQNPDDYAMDLTFLPKYRG